MAVTLKGRCKPMKDLQLRDTSLPRFFHVTKFVIFLEIQAQNMVLWLFNVW